MFFSALYVNKGISRKNKKKFPEAGLFTIRCWESFPSVRLNIPVSAVVWIFPMLLLYICRMSLREQSGTDCETGRWIKYVYCVSIFWLNVSTSCCFVLIIMNHSHNSVLCCYKFIFSNKNITGSRCRTNRAQNRWGWRAAWRTWLAPWFFFNYYYFYIDTLSSGPVSSMLTQPPSETKCYLLSNLR